MVTLPIHLQGVRVGDFSIQNVLTVDLGSVIWIVNAHAWLTAE